MSLPRIWTFNLPLTMDFPHRYYISIIWLLSFFDYPYVIFHIYSIFFWFFHPPYIRFSLYISLIRIFSGLSTPLPYAFAIRLEFPIRLYYVSTRYICFTRRVSLYALLFHLTVTNKRNVTSTFLHYFI